VGLAQDVLVVAGLAGVAIAGLFFIIRGAGQALEGFEFPKIELPSLPDITFPTINFPEITFPTFEFPDITFPSFPEVFGDAEVPEIPEPFVEPERMDVPFGDTETIIDIVPDVTGGRGERLRDVIGEEETMGIPSTGSIVAGISEPFNIIEETQAEFQERAAAFAEALPEVTFSTSIADGDIVFGRQLSRESEDFEDVLAAEARRSETIFAGLFGNVQNPEFGA